MDTLIYQIEKYSRLRPRSVSDECSPAPPKRAKKGGRDGWVHFEEPRIELVLGIHAHTVTVQIVWEPVGSGRMVLEDLDLGAIASCSTDGHEPPLKLLHHDSRLALRYLCPSSTPGPPLFNRFQVHLSLGPAAVGQLVAKVGRFCQVKTSKPVAQKVNKPGPKPSQPLPLESQASQWQASQPRHSMTRTYSFERPLPASQPPPSSQLCYPSLPSSQLVPPPSSQPVRASHPTLASPPDGNSQTTDHANTHPSTQPKTGPETVPRWIQVKSSMPPPPIPHVSRRFNHPSSTPSSSHPVVVSSPQAVAVSSSQPVPSASFSPQTVYPSVPSPQFVSPSQLVAPSSSSQSVAPTPPPKRPVTSSAPVAVSSAHAPDPAKARHLPRGPTPAPSPNASAPALLPSSDPIPSSPPPIPSSSPPAHDLAASSLAELDPDTFRATVERLILEPGFDALVEKVQRLVHARSALGLL